MCPLGSCPEAYGRELIDKGLSVQWMRRSICWRVLYRCFCSIFHPLGIFLDNRSCSWSMPSTIRSSLSRWGWPKQQLNRKPKSRWKLAGKRRGNSKLHHHNPYCLMYKAWRSILKHSQGRLLKLTSNYRPGPQGRRSTGMNTVWIKLPSPDKWRQTTRKLSLKRMGMHCKCFNC